MFLELTLTAHQIVVLYLKRFGCDVGLGQNNLDRTEPVAPGAVARRLMAAVLMRSA